MTGARAVAGDHQPAAVLRRDSCENTRENLAGMLRKGSAGSNTVTDHLKVRDAAIAADPP